MPRQRTMIPFTCAQCGTTKVIPSFRSSQKYCSRTCLFAARTKSNDWRCIDCGAGLSAPHVKRCRTCAARAKIGTTRPLKQSDAVRENGITYWLRPCAVCGKDARTRGGNALRQVNAYCSAECRTSAQIALNNKRVSLTCAGCGNDFQLPQAWVKRGAGRFCSMTCYRKYSGETGPEAAARKCLESLGIPFVQEHKIGRFFIDFYLTDRAIAFEVDGAYWHIPDAEKDARRDAWLAKRGVSVIRLDADTLMRRKSPAERMELIASTLHVDTSILRSTVPQQLSLLDMTAPNPPTRSTPRNRQE